MNKKKVINIMKSRFQTLIDSESEEETERKDDEESARPIKHDKKVKQHKKENSKSKLRKVSLRAAKDEAMKQIQSETQRLMREAKISLPYHKPKQRTLQEFLNRKKVITVLPTAPTMAAKLKMSSAIVDEVLKEKEKEAEIFYKSSDSEEEIVEMNKENINKEHPNTECTKISQKDNASRKLFVDNNLCTVESSEGKNSTSTTKEMDETLTEIKETENNEKTVLNDETNNDANDLMAIKTHDGSNITENKKEDSKFEKITETTKNNKIDSILQRDIEIESKEENSYNNSDEYNSKIAVAHEDTSTSKSNYDYANMMKECLGIAANELDDYNEYGLPPPKFHDSPNMNGKKSLQDIKSLKPKLRGTPGTMIDLTSDIKPCKKGINDLIDRFMCKHSKVNEHTNDTSEVTVTQIKESVNGLTIIKTPLPYRLPIVSDEDPKFNKPGAKLTWLKEELKHKMAMKRDEEWKQREEEMKEQEIEWNESIDEEDNYLNEPYSPSIESHKTEVDELEEYDVHTEKSTKRKKKSAFIDDEAEVSGDEISDNDEIEDEDEDEDEEYPEEEECQKFIIKNDDENNTNRDSNDEKCKTFKRIVIPLEEDSRSSIAESNENNKDKEAPILQSTKIGMFGRNANENELLFSNNDSDIPVSQACVKSDLKRRSETPQSKINTFDLVSPITQLTALNVHLEEESELLNDEKPLNNTIFEGGTQTQALFQQIRDCKKTVMSQKKLFSDRSDVLDEELLEICSGKFPKDKVSLNFSKECNNVSESQLLELCSGTFSSQPNNENNLVDFSDEIPCSTQISEKGGSLSAEKDEQQSKKETITWNKLRVLSSDDEDEVVNEDKQRKKKVKKLNLSDDEEDNSSASSSDNEHEEDEEKFIDYDSEENEVVIPKKDIRQYAAKFLEEEAELSESDCDVSADEDEEDLDNLELEDADNEEIDEMQVKNQLGKLHMKQLLDEDQKEVKMLQELLFEDGDLYSESTRKRKFKWRNIDKQDENDDSQPLEEKDGWVDLSDEEDEIKWRKMKYERDKFLAEKMKNIDTEIENDLNNSEVFKFGLKILKKRRIDELQTRDTLVETIDSTMQSKTPHSIAEIMLCRNIHFLQEEKNH
ncbi:unnamed protein product [Xylocopa violacea]|uniref:Claspin n=1 Tax=Xylocopa violacea TaxID=135666 RepID=A0ABP1PAJ3_XYLVO